MFSILLEQKEKKRKNENKYLFKLSGAVYILVGICVRSYSPVCIVKNTFEKYFRFRIHFTNTSGKIYLECLFE